MWPGDVINDVMNMYLHKCSHNLTIPMHRKFCDDIFACFLVIMKNVVISFIKEYIEGRLWGHPVTSLMTSSSWKYFFWQNLGRSFHIWGQIEAVLNISKFSKWPPYSCLGEVGPGTKRRSQWITLFEIAGRRSTSQAYWVTLALISNIANYLKYNSF